MTETLFCLLEKYIYIEENKLDIEIGDVITNLSENTKELIVSRSKETFSEHYAEFLKLEKQAFKSSLTIDTGNNRILDFMVYSHVINRLDNHIHVIEIYIENIQFFKEIITSIDSCDLIGIVILYDDKILFCDSGFKKMTGYSEEILKHKKFSSLFKKDINVNIQNLLKSIKTETKIRDYFNFLPLITQNGIIKYFHAQALMLNYKGLNAICMYFIDASQEKIYRDLYNILYNVNKVVSKNFFIYDTFFQELCKQIVENENISFVWVGEVKGKKIKSLAKAGDDSGYLDYFLQTIGKEGFDIGPTFQAVKHNVIKVNPNTFLNPSMKLWRDEMLKRNFLSSCAVPFSIKDDVYVLNIYTRIENFFSKEILDVLKLLQEVIINKLKNIKELSLTNIFYKAVENTFDWILVTDKNGTIEYVNDAVTHISGYEREELIGANPSLFKSGLYGKEFYKKMWDTILSGNIYKGVVINKRKDGEFFQVYNTIVPILENDRVIKFVSIAKDITKEVYLEKEIYKFKYRDILSGLLNTDGFIKEVNKEISTLKEINIFLALLVIDIFNFARLNNIYGFDVCNEVLKKISMMLLNIFQNKYIIARLGSDSFGIFVSLKHEKDILNIFEEIFSLFSKEVEVKGEKIKVDINIGAAFYKKELNALDLLIRAHLALDQSKNQGPNTFYIYNQELYKSVTESFEKTKILKESIESNYFIFHLQPIYETKTYKLSSVEALVRIKHPEKGIIYPSYFIDLVENSDLLYEFETILFKKIVEYEEIIFSRLKRYIQIAMNISAKSFSNGNILNYVENIPQKLRSYINLEITERVFLENIDDTINIMNELKRLGFTIEIDDFGTGFSSMGFIDRVPADLLKIDMVFVKKMMSNKKIQGIIKTIIELANNLGMETIAEGVEAREQVEILTKLGCNYLQGYYFAKPMPLDDMINFLIRINGKNN